MSVCLSVCLSVCFSAQMKSWLIRYFHLGKQVYEKGSNLRSSTWLNFLSVDFNKNRRTFFASSSSSFILINVARVHVSLPRRLTNVHSARQQLHIQFSFTCKLNTGGGEAPSGTILRATSAKSDDIKYELTTKHYHLVTKYFVVFWLYS